MTALLSVLIATCPCALSLATPTALTAAGINLLGKGILVNNTEAITQLTKIDHWYFDKTGTLSEDKLTINNQHLFTDNIELKSITASLQQISNHPIASAFQHHELKQVINAQEHSGLGVSGVINQQQWYMGSLSWMDSLGVKIPTTETDNSFSHVYLACEHQLIALFELAVPIRAGARELLSTLKNQGKSLTILSGDKSSTVKNWAQMLDITNYHGDLTAVDKINFINSQQHSGQRCVMVGDGVNDAPVLSQADVSISLKQGAYLAHSASDMIVLGKSLSVLTHALTVSAKSNAIIKQNLSWSLVYNLSVTPIAMMGLLAPWMAAIGMSLSSLLVVLNSRRLL
jgi:Cu2+-exporting ATPase